MRYERYAYIIILYQWKLLSSSSSWSFHIYTEYDINFLWSHVKGSVFLKNRHFIIQESFNKLIYGINTIMKCGTWQPVKFRLVSRSWNEMILSYLWINVANINSEIR